jgi:predicted O-methyltransferase YrrM
MIDQSGIFGTIVKRLPDPLKNLYRNYLPQSVRQSFRDVLPYEQNMVRAVRFWASPGARRRRVEELQRCRTPEDYFAFATNCLGHQQWKQEITGFLTFAREHKPIRIGELGLFLGGTNLMLTHALPTVREVIGVDLHLRNKSQLRYFGGSSHRQTYIEGRTCDDATLEKVSQALGGGTLDLLFIDADHSYDGVKQDFMHYRHFVRDGGIIAFHDIVQDHLTKFGHDPATFVGARSGEVFRFWKDLKPYYDTSREFVVDYNQDGCGIGAIIYSSAVKLPSTF